MMHNDTYRPFVLSPEHCQEILTTRITRLTKRRVHVEILEQSVKEIDRELAFLGWLQESLHDSDTIYFTYYELQQFVGDSREP